MNSPKFPRHLSSRLSFVLLEAMLGVAVFSLGVIALGHAVNNCLAAETTRTDTAKARLALLNRVAEIEAGRVTLPEDKPQETELEGMWAGMTLREKSTLPHGKPLENEKEEELANVRQIDVEIAWTVQNQPQSTSVTFYQLQRTPRGNRIIQPNAAPPGGVP